ncbi:MAG: glutamyl-tRNA synthetase GltX, partial [Pseudomonadota bacterium]
CPIILGEDGLKLSKRRGAVSVTAYEDAGYLPEAMLNYLARLGWSHGDEELFTRDQMVEWFDGSHLSKSPAQWDPAKLSWVNAHYLKQADDARLASLVTGLLARRGLTVGEGTPLAQACALFKDRCHTLADLADWIAPMIGPVHPREEDLAAHVSDAARAAFAVLAGRLEQASWDAAGIQAALKETLAQQGLKMPQLAPAVRVVVCGRAQTPSVDQVLALYPRDRVVARLKDAAQATL